MRNEIDSLNKLRSQKIENFRLRITSKCLVQDSGVVLLQFVVSPKGAIKSYEIIARDEEKVEKEISECLKEAIESNRNNFGQIKVIPNARNGQNASDIAYTIPLKKSN